MVETSNFDNTGVFDLEEPMFVIDFLTHLLAKAIVTDVKYFNYRVDIEVTMRNMQYCII